MKFIGFHVEYLEQPSKYEVVYVDDQDLEDYDNLVKNTDKDIIFWKNGEICDYIEHGVSVVFVELENTKIELMHPYGENSPISKFLENHKNGSIHIYALK